MGASVSRARVVVVGTGVIIVEGASGARVASSAQVTASVEIGVDTRVQLVPETISLY